MYHQYEYGKRALIILLVYSILTAKGIAQKPSIETSVPTKTGSTTAYLPSSYSKVSENYINVWEPQQPFSDAAAVTTSANVYEVNRYTQYLDGLGRLLQNVSWKTSPSQKDIISPFVYDDYGREQYKFLPYEADGTDGAFRTNPFGEQKTFYSTTYKAEQPALNGEQFYYSHTKFEQSPLDRVVKTFAPGNSWAGSEDGSAEKAVSVQYRINTAEDVRIWDIGFDAFADGNNIPASASDRTYAAGALYKTVTLDEHNNAVVEYKDKEGHIILKKVQIGTIASDFSGYPGFLSTYYVYDDLGQLRFTIPPKAVAKMIEAQNWTLTSAIVSELCFRYEYDERQRMKAKKVPGSAWIYMVYDKRNRLCFTQDGNLRNKQQWMYTIYEDDLNRPVETGIVKYPGSWNNLVTAAGATTNTTVANLVVPTRVNTISSYTATNSIEFTDGFTSENGANFTAEIVKALSASQTGNVGATLSGGTWYPLTYTYYDNYGFGTTKSYNTANNSQLDDGGGNLTATLETLPSIASTMTKGMVTGTRVRVIENPDNPEQGGWLETVTFYDDKGRPVQVQTDNYKGGKDVITNRYNFTSKVVAAYLEHTNPAAGMDGSNRIGIKTSILYDHAGRVTKTTKKVNYQASSYTRTIAENVYDALGQLKNKKIGQKSATNVTEMENDQYSYNIRGWLKGVNYYNGTTYSSQQNSANNKWFAFDLDYDWGMTSSQYNGNIAGTRWKSAGDGKERAYGYGYDQANRLLKGDFTQYNSSWGTDAVLNFDVKMGDGMTASSAYDENGNIKQMQQWGLAGTASQQMDNLIYTYAAGGVSNKLLKVKDNGVQPTVNIGDFNNKNTADNDDYGYDVNGNLITDKNKGMNGVTGIDQPAGSAFIYNHLNLPYKITVNKDDGSLKGTITYIYDAAGNKLEKRTVEGTTQTQTAYLGGFVYENNKLQFFGHEEGRVRPITPTTANGNQAFAFDYFLKDHLGNVRTVLTDEKRSDIYPALSLEGAQGSGEVINQNDVWEKADGTAFDVTGKRTMQANMQNYSGNPAPLTYSLPVRSSTGKVGAGKLIKVMSGDKIHSTVQYYYSGNTESGAPNGLNTLVSSLTAVLTNSAAASPGLKANASVLSSAVSADPNAAILFYSQSSSSNNGRPQAFLNVLFFDEQFKIDRFASYYQQIKTTSSSNPGQEVVINRRALQNGYCYIYISNETNDLVYFDNLTLTHERGPLLEETHYYPFGLTMAGISSRAAGSIQNKNKFNGGNELQSGEFSDGSGLELYDAKNRMYDGQIGRFGQIDPLADMSQNISSYAFGSNNPISINDPLGLQDSSHILSPVTVTTYVKNKANQFANWFTGANVGYNGSGWGHGPRAWLGNQLGLGHNANNLWELGMQSMLQNNQVNLTGSLLNGLKTDPAMIAFRNKIIAALKADPRFRKLAFVTKGGEGVQFGGQRWGSKNENWGALNGNNPALHGETWAVGGNELTWAVRHAEVDYSATVKTDGTIVVSFHLSDRLDLSPQPGRSEAYNNISQVTGFMYHDVAGGNSEMKVNADWQTTVK